MGCVLFLFSLFFYSTFIFLFSLLGILFPIFEFLVSVALNVVPNLGLINFVLYFLTIYF